MNRKAWIILILLVHLMVHPLTHAFASSALDHTGIVVSDRGDTSSSSDECGLCRVMSALTLFVLLSLLTAPRSSARRRVVFSPVAWSVELVAHVPSRAPPVLA